MDNLFSLHEKKILVTGASSGIGKQISISLSGMGANVIVTGRNEARLEETFKQLEGNGHTIAICDLTNPTSLQQLVDGSTILDGIVFCAGVIEYLPVKFISAESVNTVFQTNYTSQVLLLQKLLKAKKINKGSSLVFISSISATIGVAGTLIYAASKAAINASVKVLASELAGMKIRVNAICPGIVRTPLLDNQEVLNKEKFDEAEKEYPLGYGEPTDVANAVIYYISPASKWVTGNIMIMDGGYTLK